MSLLSAPPGGDQDRATELNTFAWTLFSLSTVFVAARVYSRLRLTRNFWYDDLFILLSWVQDHSDTALQESQLTSYRLLRWDSPYYGQS